MKKILITSLLLTSVVLAENLPINYNISFPEQNKENIKFRIDDPSKISSCPCKEELFKRNNYKTEEVAYMNPELLPDLSIKYNIEKINLRSGEEETINGCLSNEEVKLSYCVHTEENHKID